MRTVKAIVVYEDGEFLWPIVGIEGHTEEEVEAEISALREKLADMAVAKTRETYDPDEDLDEDDRRSRDEHLQEIRERIEGDLRGDPWGVGWYVAGERTEDDERKAFAEIEEKIDAIGGWGEVGR